MCVYVCVHTFTYTYIYIYVILYKVMLPHLTWYAEIDLEINLRHPILIGKMFDCQTCF